MMSEYFDDYPFQEGLEAANQFRRIDRELTSLAEGPIEIKIGRTSLFVLDVARDIRPEVLEEYTFSDEFWKTAA